MIRYSNKHFEGDHFNFHPVSVGSVERNYAVVGSEKFNATGYIQKLNTVMKKSGDDILVDEINPYQGKLRDFGIETIDVTIGWKRLTKYPKKLAFWHVTILTPKFCKRYQSNMVDYVFLEEYWPFKNRLLLWLIFKFNYLMAHHYNIAHKLVFGLGVNQNPLKRDFKLSKINQWISMIHWCDDEETLRAQIGSIKRNCKDIGGIGFFITREVVPEYLRLFDKVALEEFPD